MSLMSHLLFLAFPDMDLFGLLQLMYRRLSKSCSDYLRYTVYNYD